MKRILIANRGEIAIRVARSVKDLGMKAVGVCSDDDIDALHLSKMDEVYSLESKGVSAYLDIKKIIAIAKENNIDAIHPGYGFLSENPKFASTIKRAGITFIGPEEKTLKLFGDKVKAKELAKKHNVRVVEGTDKDTNLREAKKFFSSLKKHSSVIIKAMSGGGGRGMRIVRSEDDLKEALIRAASEAKAAFGSDEVYVEEYLDDSRHVEIQIIGDGLGNVSHLYDRECTVQRRYQKIIEVAPSPTLSKEVRSELIDAALRMTKAVKYKGLCTVEFLLDNKSNQFRFIEGNARLQVEHTVTESILGLDVVKAQIQIAFGKTLKQIKYDQDNIPVPRGFAIQARINMEVINLEGNVKPSGGMFSKFDLPTGPGVRVDTSGYTGYTSNPAFDSLIAKVITFSPEDNYSKAVKRLYRGLCEFNVEGVTTNLQLVKNIF
jgi:pyruvate carboxylase